MNRRLIQTAVLGLLCFRAVTLWPQQGISLHDATETERTLTIRIFAEVTAYYQWLGFSIPEDVSPTIVFQDTVSLEGRTVPDALRLFDPDSMSIRLVHFGFQKFNQ
ncbi:MAG: hypothetical protein JSV89_02570 [Spirochaetaceae bacterium]|nr:MAG: hypothetical protein JSV89_02570 [Spirochaetaceae bacterium]